MTPCDQPRCHDIDRGGRCAEPRTKGLVMCDVAVRHCDAQDFVLHFPSLFAGVRGFAFPCDERGEVDVSALSPRARANYLSARSAVGRDFGVPAVVAHRHH